MFTGYQEFDRSKFTDNAQTLKADNIKAGGKTYEHIPADEVEAAAVAQIKSVLASPEAITAVCQFIQRNGAQITEDVAMMAMHRLGDVIRCPAAR